jgi:transglutaminase-like putative cysteine protease
MQKFLQATEYIDYNSEIIQNKAMELFNDNMSNAEKSRIAYEFVRDEISHSFDCNAKIITAKASEVLKHKTGICHAKANLLTALLRLQGIPTGFCFQRLTLLDDDSMGYGVHAYNAVFLENKWIKLDARGNKKGVNAQFSMGEPVLAFPVRAEYDECYYNGIYAYSHMPSMQMLEKAETIQDIRENIPDVVTEKPDIQE